MKMRFVLVGLVAVAVVVITAMGVMEWQRREMAVAVNVAPIDLGGPVHDDGP